MKRYGISFIHEEVFEHKDGPWVQYEDAQKEIDKLQKKVEIYEKVIRDEIRKTY